MYRQSLSSAGPLVTSHAAFICGRPEIFDSPLIVNVSAAVFTDILCGFRPTELTRFRGTFATSRRTVDSPYEKSRKTSSAISASPRFSQMSFSVASSSGFT